MIKSEEIKVYRKQAREAADLYDAKIIDKHHFREIVTEAMVQEMISRLDKKIAKKEGKF